jgi:hypothetical protein
MINLTCAMSLADVAARQGQCPARTAQGMRTPTGDYMACSGGHAVGDLHGAAFGASGWFSWTDDRAMSPADRLAHEAASYVRTADRTSIRTRICRDTIARLSAMDARTMAPADFDHLAQAQAELAQLSER